MKALGFDDIIGVLNLELQINSIVFLMRYWICLKCVSYVLLLGAWTAWLDLFVFFSLAKPLGSSSMPETAMPICLRPIDSSQKEEEEIK